MRVPFGVPSTFTRRERAWTRLPAGTGANQPVEITVGGQTSNQLLFSYDPPTLASLSPTTGPAADELAKLAHLLHHADDVLTFVFFSFYVCEHDV